MTIGVTDPSYRCVGEQTKAGLKQTSRTKAFGCVGKDFRAALSTNSEYAGHYRRVTLVLAVWYCAKFHHTLRAQYRNQVAEFVFDIPGNCDRVGNLLTQQRLIAAPKTMERLSNGILRHAQLRSNLRP